MDVKILPLAWEDINQALIYIAADNPSTADGLYGDIMKALNQAAEFPYASPRLVLGGNSRRCYYRLYVKPYNIFYRVDRDTVIVMRALHERMDAAGRL